jgi:amino acid adenylation domain-containing protein
MNNLNIGERSYSGEEDVVVGSPIAGRRHSEVEGLIGFFVNNLVLRTKINKQATFREILENVRETTLGAYLHQDIPFEKLVEELQPVRDLSHSPLFQVMFVMQNLPVPEFELPDLSISEFDLRGETSSYDLSLVIQNDPSGLAVEIEYNTDLFRDSTIKQMLAHYQRLLTAVVEDADREVMELPLLSENEIEHFTLEWNETSLEFPDDICVHTWFESIANEQPDAIAISYNPYILPDYPEKLTYSELNKHANQLAWYLQEFGLQPEQRVGICMERSPEMIIGILAVLKAGGAFVPIDPAYPAARLQFIIEDSEISLLLTQEMLAAQFAPSPANVISLDRDRKKIQNYSDANLNLSIFPHNLAYVIYTSGSTGEPKGTLLQHQGMCNLATSQKRAFNVGPGNKIMQFSSLSFDASVWEFVMAVLSGSTLCLTDREVIASGQNMTNYMQDEKINTITLPPSVLAVLPPNDLPDLKVLITAGEAVSSQLVENWAHRRRFFNAYGPTETTVCASMHLCEGDYQTNPPIGKPIGNFKLYITEHPSQPVPIGVHGELCVAGVGLARGYINRADLTAEKFTPSPFSREPGARLYRTGDLARYLPDGDIEFIGRIDDQVKVRGFRIELGEIDALLMKREDVRDAVTIVREDIPKDKRLVSYVVSSGESKGDFAEIKEFLRKQLPEYMVPSAFVNLDKLPLTSSGKVDRRALPIPEISREELKTEYVAPRNENEKKLVKIVSTLLNLKKVGVNDNFFELGGHSLLATQFMSRVFEGFGMEIPLRVLFEKPTVASVAEEIEKRDKGEEKPAAPAIKRVSREAHRVKRSGIT